MTKNEVEIIVTAKVEGAITEFKKIVPEIKKIVKEVQNSFDEIDTKKMTNNVKNAVQSIKNKMEDLKKSNQNNVIKLTVNNKEAQKQISQVQKEIDSLQQKITSQEMKLKIKGEVEVDTSKITSSLESSKVSGSEKKENSGPDIFTQIGNISGAITSQIIPLAGKLSGVFSPLKDSSIDCFNGVIEQVKIASGQMDGLKSSVSGIFDNAFTIALNYNGNGDAIVRNLSDSMNNLLGAIDNVVKSEGFQNWLKTCSDKFREISEKISQINWQPLIDTLATIGETIGTAALGILDGLVGVFKWLTENPTVAEILAAIAIGIGLATMATILYTAAKSAETTALIANAAAWIAANAPIILITAAIAAIIAIIILCVKHWDEIKAKIQEVCENIKQKISEWVQNIKEFFTNLIETIKLKWNEFWSNLYSKCNEIVNNIKTGISTALENIRNIWDNIWTSIKNTVSNIWNGIWNTIKNVINSILGGIEGFVNGTIRGINILLSGISNIANSVGSLIGLKPINLQINTISLPRLAKGGVLTRPTAVLAGEYLGARNNPEIITPQNIMYDTMRKVIEDTEFYSSNNGQPIYLTVNVGNKKLGQILLENLRDIARTSGKDINTLVQV